MRARAAIPCVLLGLFLVAGCMAPSAPPDDDAPDPDPDGALVLFFDGLAASPELRFETDHGTIRMLLYTELMPQTAGRIGTLADSGFYDGTLIHRVVDDFVIQGGDPSGTGVLGSGETIPHEIHPDLLFGGGALGLARDIDPDSGDAQWFVTERPALHLSDPDRSSAGDVFGAYALFGQVFEGMEVVREIASVPVVPGIDRPIEDVLLEAATLEGPPRIDLLQHPRTIGFEGDGLILERPLHVFAGHAFDVVVYWEAEDAPPEALSIRYTKAERGPVEVRLASLPDDPTVFAGNVTLPEGGTWREQVGDREGAETVALTVHAWHDAYQTYLRG